MQNSTRKLIQSCQTMPVQCSRFRILHTLFSYSVKNFNIKKLCQSNLFVFATQGTGLNCLKRLVAVVRRVCLHSWWSYEGFSRQVWLYRSGLPLPSPEFTSHLCVLYFESFLPPACAIFSYLVLLLLGLPIVGRLLPWCCQAIASVVSPASCVLQLVQA